MLTRQKKNLKNASSQSYIPKDAVSAVVSQFDKLNSNMKTILRVAAVCGNFFYWIYIHFQFFDLINIIIT